MKRITYWPFAIPLLTALLGYVGCENAQQVLERVPIGDFVSNHSGQAPSDGQGFPALPPNGPTNGPTNGPVGGPVGGPVSYAPQGNNANERIRVASFNIQAFGPSKMGDQWVMQRLAAVIQNFDLVAIQEIRSKDQSILDVLLRYVNQNGLRYNYLLGERLGRTVSKEQYAYIYNTATISTEASTSYTVRDDEDLLHRPPLVARFVARTSGRVRPFTFTLANVHTDPDEVAAEVAVLGRVYQAIASYEANVAGEDDVIMMGDFNADAQKLAAVATQREYTPTIVSWATNVAGNKQYDNILINPYYCREFTGNCGVLDLAKYFGLTQEETKRLSDHLPVWCEFFTAEDVQRTASNPADSAVRR